MGSLVKLLVDDELTSKPGIQAPLGTSFSGFWEIKPPLTDFGRSNHKSGSRVNQNYSISLFTRLLQSRYHQPLTSYKSKGGDVP